MSVEAPAAVLAAVAALTGAVLSFIGNRAAKKRESVDRRLEAVLTTADRRLTLLLDHADQSATRQDTVIARQDERIQDLEARLAMARHDTATERSP